MSHPTCKVCGLNHRVTEFYQFPGDWVVVNYDNDFRKTNVKLRTACEQEAREVFYRGMPKGTTSILRRVEGAFPYHERTIASTSF